MRSGKSIATNVAAAAIATVVTLAQAQAQQQASAQPNPAAQHLAAARASLNRVLNLPAPGGDAFTKLTELKTEYIALEKAASTASPEWATRYQAIERLLTDLVGATPASEAVGTSGTAGANLNPSLTASLLEFRKHMTDFSKAMATVAPAPGAAAAASASAPPTTTSTTPASATAEAATPPAPTSAAPASVMPATADATVVAQLDQVVRMIEDVLKANAAQSTGTVSVERSTLEQMKAQLEQVRARVKKP